MTTNNDHRLVVVDDDPGVRELVVDIAEGMEFAVRSFDGPGKLWNCLGEFDPTVIILDLEMPEMDGVSVLRQLGQEKCNAGILVASGLDSRTLGSTERLGQEYGLHMIGTLQKPFEIDNLEKVLSSVQSANAGPDEAELARAIEKAELIVHYQPKVRIDENGNWRLDSTEALVRWDHPKLGVVPPDAFIPLAEQCGLIVPLTRVVLNDALKRLNEWEHKGLQIAAAVNVSTRLLDDTSLPDEFADLARNYNVSPSRLILELTETAAMTDVSRSMEILTRFRVKGFSLSLDDFGTGFSSLVQLYRMPFNEIKIDKSFVLDIGTNPESETIVKAIMGLAEGLGLKVCGEGVESQKTMQFLADLGCHVFQGYHIGRPGPSAAITDDFGEKGKAARIEGI